MSIASEIIKLNDQRIALANNLTTKGVTASTSETLTQLVPKVLDIPTGGGGGYTYGFEIVAYSNITLTTIDKP